MMEVRPTILVVDDDSINLQILHNALAEEYDLLTASAGKQALVLASQFRPDLILLDIMLPDISGHDVCQALKKNELTKHIPVIFVKAQSEPEDELFGLELGAVDYFKKPFVLPLIKVRIRKQIELVKKTAALEKLAWIDGLTGISNRRSFDSRYYKACKYGVRNKRQISLILLDIDYFKQYNDCYGHAKGDAALIQVAHALEFGASRPLDFVARYGGEEFVILLTDVTETEGQLVAEKVRKLIEELAIPHEKASLKKTLTISAGVATSPKGGLKFSEKALLEAADRYLYEAKNLGRNSVVSQNHIPSAVD
jgi:diguanylate cyclase (GGDEF)-like protein